MQEKKTKDAQITFRLTSEELERLQKLADKYEIPRHRFIHNLVVVGLDTMEDLEKIGVVKATLLARSAQEFIKERIGKTKKTAE